MDRWLKLGLAVVGLLSALSCALGVVWYAKHPGVLSSQVSFVLVLPAVCLACVAAGRRLPVRLRWTFALLCAAVGPAGYVVYGGPQWWQWGQLAAIPLIVLWAARTVELFSTADHDPGVQPSGLTDGPWGPPL